MNSLKASITTLENIVGAFFNPIGMTVYWYNPHSMEKVVVYLYYGGILISWYPENPFVNEYAS